MNEIIKLKKGTQNWQKYIIHYGLFVFKNGIGSVSLAASETPK